MDFDVVREFLDYDPAAGTFIWRARLPRHFLGEGRFSALAECNLWNGRQAGKSAGSVTSSGYLQIKTNRHGHHLAHRLAWLYMTGRWPIMQIDHIDGNRLNNKWSNLREASQSQNSANATARPSSSGYRGVSWYKTKNCWRAHIKAQGKGIHLGYFSDPKKAAEAYREAAKKYHGDFTRY